MTTSLVTLMNICGWRDMVRYPQRLGKILSGILPSSIQCSPVYRQCYFIIIKLTVQSLPYTQHPINFSLAPFNVLYSPDRNLTQLPFLIELSIQLIGQLVITVIIVIKRLTNF